MESLGSFFVWLCVVSCGFCETPKIQENRPPSFQNHPQNYPKSIRKPPNIRPKTLQKRGLEGIALRIAFGPRFFLDMGGILGGLARFLGQSWNRLRGFWNRLGEILARPRGGLRPSLGRLGASSGILGASRERLGTSWGRFGSDSKKNLVF